MRHFLTLHELYKTALEDAALLFNADLLGSPERFEVSPSDRGWLISLHYVEGHTLRYGLDAEALGCGVDDVAHVSALVEEQLTQGLENALAILKARFDEVRQTRVTVH